MRPEYFRLLGWYLVLAVVIAACSANGLFGGSSINDLRSVQDATWILQSYGPANALTPALPDSRVTLIFDFDAKSAGGNSGCNHYSASFTIKGDNLSFGDAVGTLMACSPNEIMEQETMYINMLAQVESYQVDGNSLVLLTKSGSALHFQASK